ncbi:MAG: phosphoglucosamine mutase [Marinilabiliaceae bacterium]|jgi:phosphomannomutase|nr:phosphoglucosamine mutase [Marinilabiliaceae bacterium]
MTLIKSISGIRGTIGGKPGEGLTPLDIVKFVSAYAAWLKQARGTKRCKVIVGRDARISGEMLSRLVSYTLCGYGIDVVNLGLATTPTVEVAVTNESADGGIILTASHNPGHWNALKLLNRHGEFISAREGAIILKIAEEEDFIYADIEQLGKISSIENYELRHIRMILDLPLVDVEAIRKAGFCIAVDSVNSVGGVAIPELLRELGVREIISINGEPDGIFTHNPEPLPEHLGELVETVKSRGADVGFVVDPDVDRLAIISEDGSFFNEEYTLVACADYVLSETPGNTVSNMSSTRALRDITAEYGKEWFSSAVGEVNVVEKMKEVNAVIGGEGNGGVIYPDLHYGRDALLGIALFLSHLARSGMKCSELKLKYPAYSISKNRIELPQGSDPDDLINRLSDEMGDRVTSREDGILIESPGGWVQLRKSNTEAIIRVYSEGHDPESAANLASDIIKSVKKML